MKARCSGAISSRERPYKKYYDMYTKKHVRRSDHMMIVVSAKNLKEAI